MARVAVYLLGILGICWSVDCDNIDQYDNHTLIRLYPTKKEHLKVVHDFLDKNDEIEIFKRSRDINDTFDALIPPKYMSYVENLTQNYGLGLEVKANYGRRLDLPDERSARRVLRGFNLYGYNSYAAINEHLDSIANRHSDLVRLQILGNSYEGRRMRLVKISLNHDASNPIIFIDAGIHAREWAAPAMALYIINHLVLNPETRWKELNGVDWYILPLVNPDGYEYTRSSKTNRLWRKTRSKSSNYCYGVDGNRNYGYKWAVSGASANPCDKETYAGPRPFSEPETQMVRNVMKDYKWRIKLYISLHAYGQYLVYPWGYTGEILPEQWRKLDALARSVSNAVQKAGGQPFKVLSAGKWYPAAGGSDDYAFGEIGIPYSYTMELTDDYEFQYPEYLLRKSLPQLFAGFKVFAAQIKKEFGLQNNG